MATSSDCFTCSQSKKKYKGSVMCTGCQRRFCNAHHQEHRKALHKDFDELIQQHDLVQQMLDGDTRAEQSIESRLLKKIDAWEKEMIQNIKATAASRRTSLKQMITMEKNQIKHSFKLMADELKSNQTSNDYVDTDIQQWQKQLKDFRQKLDRLQTSNNDLIDVEIKPIDWENGISVHQRRELVFGKKTAPMTIATRMQQRRVFRCVNCEDKFAEGEGFDEKYCSSSCANEDENNVCFHEDCVVSLATGSTKLVKDIRPGDVLQTPSGSAAIVLFVVKSFCKDRTTSMVTFDNGLMITPWHPIRISGEWQFPANVKDKTKMECEAVYNFALDSGHIAMINGVECVTLGHHFKGDVVEHPYYGTEKVLDDLRALDRSNSNFIELPANSTIRDAQTGLACGIRKCHVLAYDEQRHHSNTDI